METSLQGTHLTNSEIAVSAEAEHTSSSEGHHIHLPNPSLWPLILTVAIALTIGGLLSWNGGSVPWLSLIAAPFVLVGIMGWALEDPMAPPKSQRIDYRPTTFAASVLQQAENVLDRTVTVSSTAWSAHPVKVEVEQEGVVLALYGQVELEDQRKTLQEALLKLPGVLDVKNFIIAEDAILNAINARTDSLKNSGKLEGAKNISVLVENYIANLYGEVPNSEMKYLLEKEIVGIPGVRVVVNHIDLADIPGNLGRTRNK